MFVLGLSSPSSSASVGTTTKVTSFSTVIYPSASTSPSTIYGINGGQAEARKESQDSLGGGMKGALVGAAVVGARRGSTTGSLAEP